MCYQGLHLGKASKFVTTLLHLKEFYMHMQVHIGVPVLVHWIGMTVLAC